MNCEGGKEQGEEEEEWEKEQIICHDANINIYRTYKLYFKKTLLFLLTIIFIFFILAKIF